MPRENILTIKLTGKLFEEERIEALRRHIEVYRELVDEGYKLVVIAGGGETARKYINLAHTLEIRSNFWLDLLGINAARLNALLMIPLLQPYVYPKVISCIDEVPEALKKGEIILLGGLIPGQSTAAVAVEAAEASGSTILIDFTVVDKVYDKDPRMYPDARPIDEIDASKLVEILSQRNLPGRYELIDRRALELAIRSNIRIYIVKYDKPEAIRDILRGENPGTIIHPR